jgi:hypothetical protein
MARKMVCEWGMSDLGPLTFGKKEEQIFLAAKSRSIAITAIKIDQEVRKLVNSRISFASRTSRLISARAILSSGCSGGSSLPSTSTGYNTGVQHVIKPDLRQADPVGKSRPGRAKGGERPATA